MSETTVIDRRVMLRMDFTLTLTGSVNAGQYLVNYGSSDALAPFPAHQLFTTMQTTINNNTVNMNCQDVINAIIRSNDIRELQAYNSLTPVAFDTYYKYSDAVLSNNNPNGSYVIQSDNDLPPRGAFYVDPLTITGNTVGTGPAQARTVTLKVSVVEPLLVSPFIFADPRSNSQGIYGITNLNVVMNLAANANRAFRSANTFITSAQVSAVDKAELIFNFLTGHPSDMLPARNCVPYYELPRYISKVGVAIPNNSNVRIESQSLQLNQIPDKLFIFVRKVLSSQKVQDADAFLPIKGISINWNNNAGILSSATPYDLYRYSRESGINMNWNEFNGQALRNNPSGGNPLALPTSGSMLCLEFGRHIQIVEDWYSSGSIGSFTLQFSLDLANYTGIDYAPGTANELELVLITMNSGVFVCERGTSSIFQALLTKQMVLDASEKDVYTKSDVKRMVGGGFLDTLKSIASKVAPVAKVLAPAVLGDKGKIAANVISALGYGQTGGGSSGGRKLASRLM